MNWQAKKREKESKLIDSLKIQSILYSTYVQRQNNIYDYNTYYNISMPEYLKFFCVEEYISKLCGYLLYKEFTTINSVGSGTPLLNPHEYTNYYHIYKNIIIYYNLYDNDINNIDELFYTPILMQSSIRNSLSRKNMNILYNMDFLKNTSWGDLIESVGKFYHREVLLYGGYG